MKICRIALGTMITLLLSNMGFSQALPPVPVPVENPITEEKRVLGKILFWEEQLSSDDTVACGTCHLPASAGADPRLAINPGFDGLFDSDDDIIGSPGVVRRDISGVAIADPIFGFEPQVTGRAAQSYFASIYAPDLFWDGRASSAFVDPLNPGITVIATGGGLESQAVGPIVSSVEMAHDNRDWSEVTAKLATVSPLALATHIPADMASALNVSSTYPDLFDAAFGSQDITPVRIALAIATYERTLVADQTPWDLFIAGDTGAMTADQTQGWNLLENNTVCLNCHVPPLFTDNQFHNIGLRPANEDIGRTGVTSDSNDNGRFKTPSLRQIGLKPSMMHVGWVTDVQDTIDFYNAGSLATGHVQFTADQSGIPTNNPAVFANYNSILMPVETVTEVPMQALIIEFLENGLTDPRVANEEFPFDRPILASELVDIIEEKVPAVPTWGLLLLVLFLYTAATKYKRMARP